MSIEPYRPQYPSQPAQAYPVNPYTPVYAPIPVAADHDPVVYVPNAYGELVPMLRSQTPTAVQPAPVRDLSPRPVIDPRAQVLAAGGIAAAGVGWGASELLTAIAGIGTGMVAALAVALLALRLAPAALRTSGRGDTYISNTTTNVTNTNRWLGKSATNITNQ
jgi:hypothetical protein